jgi:hypothetical protein
MGAKGLSHAKIIHILPLIGGGIFPLLMLF